MGFQIEALMDDECAIFFKQIQDGFPAKKESISEKIIRANEG